MQSLLTNKFIKKDLKKFWDKENLMSLTEKLDLAIL